MTTGDLFDNLPRSGPIVLRPGVTLLPAHAVDDDVLEAIDAVRTAAAPRHMVTPGGHAMSVEMTNCGTFGWVSDRRGYRYTRHDPQSGRPWPPLPPRLRRLAATAAACAGFPAFDPDACLINEYRVGARMGLHQDRNERDFNQPIVSVSLGVPAVFLIGGDRRGAPTEAVRLTHGDTIIFGGPARLIYHGVRPVKAATHPRLGARRINLTFRRAD